MNPLLSLTEEYSHPSNSVAVKIPYIFTLLSVPMNLDLLKKFLAVLFSLTIKQLSGKKRQVEYYTE